MSGGLSRARARRVARLRTRHRAREGAFLVEGVRGGEEVLRRGTPVEFAVASPRLEGTPRGVALRRGLHDAGIEVVDVDDGVLGELADTGGPQGLLLVCREPPGGLDRLPVHPGARYLVLDAVQDPGNLGTLARAAAAFGVDGIVALEGTTDPWGARAVRASAGALLSLPVARSDVAGFLGWARSAGVDLQVADARGGDVAAAPVRTPWALVVGNEGAGVRDSVVEAAGGTVAVPMAAGVESLNVGMAGSILLYELTTRRGGGGTDRG